MFVVDFDDTLFDTSGFKLNLENYFLQHGVEQDVFLSTYNAADNLRVKGVFNYTFTRHLEELKNRGYEFEDEAVLELQKILSNPQLIFPDAVDFLETIGSLGKKKILMTLGNYDFQHFKIFNTGLGKYFDELVVLHSNKENELAKRIAGGGTDLFFVNDNLKENLVIKEVFPEATVVSKINERKYSIDDYKTSNLPYFVSLKEIKEYIISQIKNYAK